MNTLKQKNRGFKKKSLDKHNIKNSVNLKIQQWK